MVHESGERLYVLDGRAREDAVPEVEDVAGAARGATQDLLGGAVRPMARTEEQRRIEVALDGPVGPNRAPRLVQRNAPVGADDVAAGRRQIRQDGRRAGAEMNCRHASRL